MAARRLFAERGFKAASVRDIAAEAGVHAALVTYHFKTKRGLWQQVLDDAMTQLRDRLIAAVSTASSPRGAARAALAGYLDHLAAAPDFPRLVLRGALDGDPDVLAIAQTHLAPLFAAGAGLGDREAFITFFGAAVAPYVYTPMLAAAYGEDPLSPDATARRRAHLEDLVDRVLLQRDP